LLTSVTNAYLTLGFAEKKIFFFFLPKPNNYRPC